VLWFGAVMFFLGASRNAPHIFIAINIV